MHDPCSRPRRPALNVVGSESIRLPAPATGPTRQLGCCSGSAEPVPVARHAAGLSTSGSRASSRPGQGRTCCRTRPNQVPLANRIAINYRGDEDDFVQALDLGNTEPVAAGHAVRVIVQRQATRACFGVKFASRIGPLDFTGAARASRKGAASARGVLRRRRGRHRSAVVSRPRLGSGPVLPALRPQLRHRLRRRRRQEHPPANLDDATTTATTHKRQRPAGAELDPGGAMAVPGVSPAAKAARVLVQLRSPEPGRRPAVRKGAQRSVYAFHDTIFKRSSG